MEDEIYVQYMFQRVIQFVRQLAKRQRIHQIYVAPFPTYLQMNLKLNTSLSV
jgi:hypothetical protein